MKEITLSRDRIALVDDSDYGTLIQQNWYWLPCRHNDIGYAIRTSDDGKSTISMHQQIASTPFGIDTDHKDGNTLNNQRQNLRTCTRQQNLRNAKKYNRDCTSKFKGVCKPSKGNKWIAAIYPEKHKRKHLG